MDTARPSMRVAPDLSDLLEFAVLAMDVGEEALSDGDHYAGQTAHDAIKDALWEALMTKVYGKGVWDYLNQHPED